MVTITDFKEEIREDVCCELKITEKIKFESKVEEESKFFPSGVELKIIDEFNEREYIARKELRPGCFSFNHPYGTLPMQINKDHIMNITKIIVQTYGRPY